MSEARAGSADTGEAPPAQVSSPSSGARFVGCLGILALSALLYVALVEWDRYRINEDSIQRTRSSCGWDLIALSEAMEARRAKGLPDFPDHQKGAWAAMVAEGSLKKLPEDPGYWKGSEENFLVHHRAPGGVLCLRHGPREAEDPDLARRPREYLRRTGVTDPAILESASEDVRDAFLLEHSLGDDTVLDIAKAVDVGLALLLAACLALMGRRLRKPS